MTILDQDLQIVKCADDDKKLIRDVPKFKLVGEIMRYVALNYFDPPIVHLQPYQYSGKIGTGVPHPITAETPLSYIKWLQRTRKVGEDRLSIIGKASLPYTEVTERFLNKMVS